MFDHEDHEERRRIDEEVQIDALAVEPDQVSEEKQEQRDGGGNEDCPRARDRGVDGFCDLTRNLFHRLACLLQDARLWGNVCRRTGVTTLRPMPSGSACARSFRGGVTRT